MQVDGYIWPLTGSRGYLSEGREGQTTRTRASAPFIIDHAPVSLCTIAAALCPKTVSAILVVLVQNGKVSLHMGTFLEGYLLRII